MKRSLYSPKKFFVPFLGICTLPLLITLCVLIVSHVASDQQDALSLNAAAVENTVVRHSLHLAELEKGRLGYQATGNPRYLVFYNLARAQLRISWPYLTFLIKSQSPQLMSEFSELSQTVHTELGPKAPPQKAIQNLSADHQNDLALSNLSASRKISGLVNDILNHQARLIDNRRESVEKEFQTRATLSILLAVLCVVALMTAAYLIAHIRLLRNIVTICAWTQRVNYQGQWMPMETFLWKRFKIKASHGISEEAFSGVMGVMSTDIKLSNPDDKNEQGES